MRSKIKSLLIVLFLMLGINAIAQQTIQLHPAGSTKFEKSDMSSLRASFSFSALNAQDYACSEGEFSVLSMAKTVIGGNEGDPQIPVINELIAVPVGATPRIEVKSYHVEDYSLSDYDIKTLMPRQPSLRKDKNPEDVPFVRNHASYQKSGFSSAPKAVVEVVGTMRGVRLGKMTIEPVSYDPSSNSVRVFNDIEVEVCFDGADAKATEDLLVKTYSPYFNAVYNQMYNSNVVNSAYDDHPDLYTTPVKMLVITTQAYANSQAFHDWVTWKKQKGIYVDVYTTAQTGATAARIKSFIKKQYVKNHPTFLVIVGDKADVPNSLNSNTTNKVTDLYYSSPDGDIFPDIFLSRMPVSSTAELTNLIHKILTYEQYTMSDPSYLNNVLLIAGSDGNWNPQVGRPTINYAADNYFNTEHGFTNVYKYLNSYNGCYDNMNTGIGFANYTAHGGDTEWSGPRFTVSDANSLTNNDKYFWAMGNCCLAANWGYSGTCLAEALLRGANKGAFGYIGSCPETYWYEDYYFGVGATNTFNTTPAMSATKTGVYDALFDDSGFNTLNAVPFFGNVAVTYAHANNYTSSISDTYYWEAYHCLGDGSVMPYLTNPAANTVNHNDVIFMGTKAFTVSADAGSYVSITKDNEILGVAVVPPAGTVEVPITPVESVGEVMVVVTRQQRQPYIQTIMAIAPEGPYIALGSYTPRSTPIGKDTDLSLTFKNIGTEATDSTTTVTLTSADANVTIINGTGTFEALAADTTVTVGGFQFRLNKGV
ncbi:MAG: C25 family cysteine peptidase, partial [Prevotella sp.]